MVLQPNFQDLTASSGIIPTQFLEDIYHSFMDDALESIGRDVTFHLKPQIEQDNITQSQIQSAQYNPFFGNVAASKSNTRQPGVKNTPRDVIYKAQIRVNPIGNPDLLGIGNLKDNQIILTIVIEAMQYINECLSFTVEGRRYFIDETRPIGFSQRRYLMIKGTEINETEVPSNNLTMG